MANESDYYKALGLEEPSGKEQDPANPADDLKGGKVQEPADPADDEEFDDDEDDFDDEEDPDDDSEGDPEEEPEEEPEEDDEPDKAEKPMSKEERHRNAAARRKAEIDAAVAKAKAEAKAEAEAEAKRRTDAVIAAAGLTNPMDGNKPITTAEELEAYKKAFDAQQISKNLKAGKVTPEDIQKIVEQSESFKKVNQVLEKDAKADGDAKAAADKAIIDDQIKQINALDPSIKTQEDLIKMERGDEFYKYVVKHKLSFVEAFKLVNQDKLTEAKTAAEKQRAINLANSKDHLSRKKQRGSGSASVPADEMRMYRTLMPGATDAEIQAHYNSYLKNK